MGRPLVNPRWTPDMILKARGMWHSGELTAEEIGKCFGVSKNAIIGLAHRNAFEKRKETPRGKRKPGSRLYKPRALKNEILTGPQPGKCRNVERRLSFGVFVYCAEAADAGSSWCKHHRALFTTNAKMWGYQIPKDLEKQVSGDQA